MDKTFNEADFCKYSRRVLIAQNAESLIINKRDVFYNDDFQFSIPLQIPLYHNYYLYKYPINHIEIEKEDIWGYAFPPLPISPFILASLPEWIYNTLVNDISFLMCSLYPPHQSMGSSLDVIYAYFLKDMGFPKAFSTGLTYIGRNARIEVYSIAIPMTTIKVLQSLLYREFHEIPQDQIKSIIDRCGNHSYYNKVRHLANEKGYRHIPLLHLKDNHWRLSLRKN